MTGTAGLVILNTTKVGDNSIVVHSLSREFGRRSFITGVRKGGGMAMFQPLSVIDAEVVENPKSDLWRLRNVSARYPLNGIRSDAGKNAMTLFMSEVLFRVLRDGEGRDGLFEWCEKSIVTLDAMERDFSNFHLRFLLELCSVLGFKPSAEDLAPFAGENYACIGQLLDLSFAQTMLYPLSGVKRNEILCAFVEYLGHHMDYPLEIRSLRILRELYR